LNLTNALQNVCRAFVLPVPDIQKSRQLILSCQADGSGDIWKGSFGKPETVVLYPGGTDSSPGIISRRQRIVVPNPWPGHFVHVEAQVRHNSLWGSTEWWSDHELSAGTRANQLLPTGNIIVQTGHAYVLMYGSSSQNWSGSPIDPSAGLTSAPYRLVVTRLGKIT